MHHNDNMRLKRQKTHAGAKIAKREYIYTPKSKNASDALLMRVERTGQIITTMRTIHAQISGTRSDVQVEELLAIRTELLLFRFRKSMFPKWEQWFSMMHATPVRQKPVIVIYYKTVTKCIKREVSMHKRDIENVM